MPVFSHGVRLGGGTHHHSRREQRLPRYQDGVNLASTQAQKEAQAATLIQRRWREKQGEVKSNELNARRALEAAEIARRISAVEMLAIQATNANFLVALQHCLQTNATYRNPADVKDAHGNNLLMLAVMSGSVDIFKHLLSLNDGNNHFVAFQDAANDAGQTVQNLIDAKDEATRKPFQTALNNTSLFGKAANAAEELKRGAKTRIDEAKEKVKAGKCCTVM